MALGVLTKPHSPQHKKSTGQHHRRSKHYLKTYHPYLPLLMLVIVGLAINAFWSHSGQVLGARTSITAQQLLNSTNADRLAAQENSLSLNTQLSTAAQTKANDMVARDYWSHNTPDGRTPWSFIRQTGYQYQAAGENLAYGFPSAAAVVTGWMNSPEHRANMLDVSYQDVGFGIATAKDFQHAGPTVVVVAMYGDPVFAGSLQTANVQAQMASAVTLAPSSGRVARVQLLTGGEAPWSLLVLLTISAACLIIVLVRHGLIWKRVLVESEAFVVRHKLLDVAAIVIAVSGYVLTRSSGIIN